MERERTEKFSLVALFARLVGQGFSIPQDKISGMLSEYLQELSQTRYRPEAVAIRRKAVRTKINKERSDKALLDRVNKLTVSDEDAPPLPKPKKGGGKRR